MKRLGRLESRLTGSRCLCRTCEQSFNSTAAFDMHRTGPVYDRKCLTPEQMRERGMSTNNSGFWVTKRKDAWPIDGAEAMWPMAGRKLR